MKYDTGVIAQNQGPNLRPVADFTGRLPENWSRKSTVNNRLSERPFIRPVSGEQLFESNKLKTVSRLVNTQSQRGQVCHLSCRNASSTINIPKLH